LIIILITVVAALGFSALAKNWVAGSLSQPAADTANSFLVAIQAEDYNSAFGLFDDQMQQNMVDPEGVAAWVARGDIRPSSWSFTSRTIVERDVEIRGSVLLPLRGYAEMYLLMTRDAAGSWKVAVLRIS
jgi:hypothetical protein